MTKSYKFLKGAFSSILKPVKKKLTSIWEGIAHPMKTLETFFHKHKWLSNIAKVMMSNPATLYMVGFMVGKLWNVIRTPMFRYIINPMLELTKWVA